MTMIALALLLALFPQSGVPEYDGGCSSRLLARDTSEASIRAWRVENRRIWEALQQDRDEDSLELVGRWPWAGTYRARLGSDFANDSLVYVSSGSGIRILNASNPRRPQMVGQVNCHGSLYLTEFETRDTLLFAVYSYSMGLQVFSVADPSQPRELGRLELNGDVTGLALKDSYVFVVGWDSLFRVIDVANPRRPQQVRTLLLPFDGLSVDVKGSYAYIGGSFAGLVAVDISDPLNPQLRGQAGGFDGMAVVCDTTRPYVYVASREDGLQVVSIADPGSPVRVAGLATGDAWDVFKADTFVYLVGTVAPYQSDLFVVSVANPTQPRLVGQSRGDGWTYGVCVASPFSYAYTCDAWEGLHVRSLANPANPVVDTAMWGAWTGEDLAVQDSLVFYSNSNAGLKVISIADVGRPKEVGSYDTLNNWDKVHMVAVKDSFAYISWFNMQSGFRSIDVSDPTQPGLAGAAQHDNQGKAVVIRDTFAFVAQDYFFEVYNIARPREPVRIGRCDLPTVSAGMWLKDSLAYVAPRLQIVNVADPANPVLLSATTSNSGGVAVKDTFAYCAAVNALEVFSVAYPSNPHLITSVPTTGVGHSVEVKGSVVYVGCDRLEAFDISKPAAPVRIAYYSTPDFVRRVRHDSSYVYAACFGGGLCIFRSCTTAVAEGASVATSAGFRLLPNPTSGTVVLTGSGLKADEHVVSVRDAAGREVLRRLSGKERSGSLRLDLRWLPDGCYFVKLDDHGGSMPLKVIVSKRR